MTNKDKNALNIFLYTNLTTYTNLAVRYFLCIELWWRTANRLNEQMYIKILNLEQITAFNKMQQLSLSRTFWNLFLHSSTIPWTSVAIWRLWFSVIANNVQLTYTWIMIITETLLLLLLLFVMIIIIICLNLYEINFIWRIFKFTTPRTSQTLHCNGYKRKLCLFCFTDIKKQ